MLFRRQRFPLFVEIEARKRRVVMEDPQRLQAGNALAIDLGVALFILAFKTCDPLVRRLQRVMGRGKGQPGEHRLFRRRLFDPRIHLAGVGFAGVKVVGE